MLKRLVAIAVIFCGASLGWMILGGTLAVRTVDSDTSQRERLTAQWGTAQVQYAPQVSVPVGRGKSITIPIRSSRIDVHLDLEQRRKGLLWYNLYDVQFFAHYVIRNNANSAHLAVRFPLPASDGSYADLTYRIGGRRIDNTIALDQDRVVFSIWRRGGKRQSMSATAPVEWNRGSTASRTASNRSTTSP